MPPPSVELTKYANTTVVSELGKEVGIVPVTLKSPESSRTENVNFLPMKGETGIAVASLRFLKSLKKQVYPIVV